MYSIASAAGASEEKFEDFVTTGQLEFFTGVKVQLDLHFHVAFKLNISCTFTTSTKVFDILYLCFVAFQTHLMSLSPLNCHFHVLTSWTYDRRWKLDGCNASARWKRGESEVKATLKNGEIITLWKYVTNCTILSSKYVWKYNENTAPTPCKHS